jgi:hypothetical protein
MLVGGATFLVNATLIQTFFPIWQLNGVELPLLLIGNLVLIVLLAAICVRPAAIIRDNETTGTL